jgi:uncharacterized damage-inducible protein DinB
VKLRVYLDGAPGGPWMGHALDEVGCIWLASKQSEVITMAPQAISRFFLWLAAHDEPQAAGPKPGEAVSQALVAPGDIQAEVVEMEEIPGFGKSGGAVGFFGPDLEPATDEDIARTVRRLGYARQDLLDLVAGLPAETLDWSPPARKRTIRKNLIHVAQCHAFYLSRVLGDDRTREAMPWPWPKDTLAMLDWTMSRSVEALASLPAELREGVFPAAEPAEDWTARKMLRRFVEHEVEHVEVVRLTLATFREAGQAEAVAP